MYPLEPFVTPVQRFLSFKSIGVQPVVLKYRRKFTEGSCASIDTSRIPSSPQSTGEKSTVFETKVYDGDTERSSGLNTGV